MGGIGGRIGRDMASVSRLHEYIIGEAHSLILSTSSCVSRYLFCAVSGAMNCKLYIMDLRWSRRGLCWNWVARLRALCFYPITRRGQ